MKCPLCHHQESSVSDSRIDGDLVRRRRKCQQCNRRFTTVEMDIERWNRLVQAVKLARNAHMTGVALASAPERIGVQP